MHFGNSEGKGQDQTWLGYLAGGVEIVMVVLATLMVILVTYQVFQRYVLHYTPPWSEEMSVYLMIWFGIIGIAAGVRRNSHMALHFFADLMPLGVQRALTFLKYALVIVYAAVICREGLRLVELTMSQHSPAMGIPVGYVYLCLPVSMALIILFTAEAIRNELRKDRRG